MSAAAEEGCGNCKTLTTIIGSYHMQFKEWRKSLESSNTQISRGGGGVGGDSILFSYHSTSANTVYL